MKRSMPASWRRTRKRVPLGAQGTVLSWTRVVDAPEDYEEFAPYYLAIIELADGGRVTAQVVDSVPSTGARVTACFRRVLTDGEDGPIEYGVKFRVAS
jgi:uncharacterized OB-fold protein